MVVYILLECCCYSKLTYLRQRHFSVTSVKELQGIINSYDILTFTKDINCLCCGFIV